MPLVIVPKNYILGPANVFYRAVASVGLWNSVGATTGDVKVRANQTWFTPDLNGLLGPVQGLDYLVKQIVEADFSMAEIAGPKLALAIPGATSTVTSSADATVTPGTTTLASAAVAGESVVYVVAVTNFAAGDYMRVDVTAGGLAEYRQIDFVGTAGVRGTGTGLQFRDPLLQGHASGVAVVESLGTGDTIVTLPTVRRQPDSAYNAWAIVAQSGVGYYQFVLDSGISVTAAPEMTYGDASMASIAVTIQARYNGATTSTSPARMINPT